VPGGITGRYKYGDLVLQVEGVSKTGTIEYGLESTGTQTREGLRWRGPTATVNYRPVLSSEKAPHFKKPSTVRQKTKIWSWAPDGSPTPRYTRRLTVGC
jgi:hypothetical protein